MSQPIFKCAICGKLVPLEKTRTNYNGKAVHEACLTAKFPAKPPEYVAVSPMSLRCPRCSADPGEVCEFLIAAVLEVVHIERIKAAIVFDIAAKERFDRVRIPSKPSE